MDRNKTKRTTRYKRSVIRYNNGINLVLEFTSIAEIRIYSPSGMTGYGCFRIKGSKNKDHGKF